MTQTPENPPNRDVRKITVGSGHVAEIGAGSPLAGEGWKSDPGDTNLKTLPADPQAQCELRSEPVPVPSRVLSPRQSPKRFFHRSREPSVRTIQRRSLARFYKLCFHMKRRSFAPPQHIFLTSKGAAVIQQKTAIKI